jgi:hypothetical protein
LNLVQELAQVIGVACNAVVGVVAPQLALQRFVLLSDEHVTVALAPIGYGSQGSAKSALLCLALEDPIPLLRESPEVGETQKIEGLPPA